MSVFGTLNYNSLQIPPSVFIPWLKTQGLEEEVCALFERHSIGGISFSLLTENDLREMGIMQIGVRKRILFLVRIWQKTKNRNLYHASLTNTSSEDFSSTCTTSSSYSSSSSIEIDISESLARSEIMLLDFNISQRNQLPRCRRHHISSISDCEANPKLWKIGVSFLYCFLSLAVTSFVMVLTHERLPDSSKYPPLPDILLDNLPYIPWAFEATELVGILLFAIWLTVLLLHRHRFILFRRYCALIGTVFLLRSVTMFITSLSVPGRHLSTECQAFVFHSFHDRALRALDICLGMGMTLRGVRTCGDYMFSGHTTVITMLNFFITEYTPSSTMHQLHIFTWILNIFGIFFILAAHEHYSIDVFIAVYITSRLFLYYHWLANNHYLMRKDKKRAKMWFPLLSFFEADVRGIVPAQFSNPLVDFSIWVKCHLKSMMTANKCFKLPLHEKVS